MISTEEIAIQIFIRVVSDRLISAGKSQIIKDESVRRIAHACLNAAELFAQASTEAQSAGTAQPIAGAGPAD
jgi:hypothetical protein